jgi:type I restriction enzyme R subunit
MSDAFRSDKLFACQIPAIELLVNLGYQYLSPEQLLAARGGRVANVLLEDVLRQRLTQINQISHRDQHYPFSEANIASALERIKGTPFAGLLPTNAALYDLLTQGISLQQTLDGDTKNHTLRYVDWANPENNAYHLAAHYPLECWNSHEVRHVDLVLFVNGIPFVVIEALAPQCPLTQAEARLIRLQEDGQLPNLFMFAHLMLAINGENASYATVGVRSFAHWREMPGPWQASLPSLRQQPLPGPVKLALYDWTREQLGPKAVVRQERALYQVHGASSLQDQTLYALCRPARLLQLVHLATLFDGGVRKLARAHQFFAVERALAHVRGWESPAQRQGGLIVHSEGSGKSLTMVFLARRLALAADWPEARVVLISARPDFGAHWSEAFAARHTEPVRAKSGRDLLGLIAGKEAQLIIGQPFKLARASGMVVHRDLSPDIFVLIEENHQPDTALFAKSIRKVFPNACLIRFSGTPLPLPTLPLHALPLIDYYSHQQAQQDGLTVPLVYEARGTPKPHLINPPPTQIGKLARVDDQRIIDIAFDVCTHYYNIYRRSGLKGQLVAPDHQSAFRYKEVLDQLGYLDSALVVSSVSLAHETKQQPAPLDPAEVQLLQDFWHRMVAPYGREDVYRHQVLAQFAANDKPELFIVVDQLLDHHAEPRTAVLYLTRRLSEHTLLQTLARVNRRCDDPAKPFGQIIDYTESLGLLDQPLSDYPALAGFEAATLEGLVISAASAITALPALHADCWQLFQICRPDDEQARQERELAPRLLRTEFQTRLARFAQTLNLALCHVPFLEQCPAETLAHYQHDALRLLRLKLAAQLRYGEMPQLTADETLLWHKLPGMNSGDAGDGGDGGDDGDSSDGGDGGDHIHRRNNHGSGAPPKAPHFSLQEPARFHQAMQYYGLHSDAARADAITHHMQRHFSEVDDDKLLPLARQLHVVHEDAQARRIDDARYLALVQELYARLLQPVQQGNVAQVLETDGLILTLHGLIYPCLDPAAEPAQRVQWADVAARAFVGYLPRSGPTPYLDDSDQLKQMANQIDDYLCDVMAPQQQIDLVHANHLIEQVMHAVRKHLGQIP